MDPFSQLPIDIIQLIISFLSSKEAAQTSILSKTFLLAWSTTPNLSFIDRDFHELLSSLIYDPEQSQQVEKLRESFLNYVDRTLTRYQKQNLPIKLLTLSSHVVDDKNSSVLEQCLRKVNKTRVKQVKVYMSLGPSVSNPSILLQSIFELKEVKVLTLLGCDLVKDFQDQNGIINCSSLEFLEFVNTKMSEEVLQKIIHGCPYLERIILLRCEGPKTIQVANLNNLKCLYVRTVGNQTVDVKASSLEFMFYQTTEKYSPFMLNIEEAHNLEYLDLGAPRITDEHLHKLREKFPHLKANFPLLKRLVLRSDKIWKLNVPYLNQFVHDGDMAPSLSYATITDQDAIVLQY